MAYRSRFGRRSRGFRRSRRRMGGGFKRRRRNSGGYRIIGRRM